MNVVFSSLRTIVAVWLLLHVFSHNGWFSARWSVFHDVWRLSYLLERKFSQIATPNCAHNKNKMPWSTKVCLRALNAKALWLPLVIPYCCTMPDFSTHEVYNAFAIIISSHFMQHVLALFHMPHFFFFFVRACVRVCLCVCVCIAGV